jgi:hypothetical protein
MDHTGTTFAEISMSCCAGMCSRRRNLYQKSLGTGHRELVPPDPGIPVKPGHETVASLPLGMVRLATEEGVQQLLAGWPSRIV